MRTLGSTLALLRSEKGLGQKQMAASLNLSISAISSYEKNVHAPDLSMLCRLAEYFDVTTDYLLGRTEYRCPPETLREYITQDYTIQDMINTVVTVDREKQVSIINFVKYMKHLHQKAPGQPES
ncbi:MAG: helix-turn-helix transcriptional regulator [Lachnospiraceae bacterium]|nr:helix-turn-helix transcriptional regulator [Lachnospiraceae bacterium]